MTLMKRKNSRIDMKKSFQEDFSIIIIKTKSDMKTFKKMTLKSYLKSLEICFTDYKIAKKELIDFHKILKDKNIQEIQVKYENGEKFNISKSEIYHHRNSDDSGYPVLDKITKYFNDIRERNKKHLQEGDLEMERLQEEYDPNDKISMDLSAIVMCDMNNEEDFIDKVNRETEILYLKKLRKHKKQVERRNQELSELKQKYDPNNSIYQEIDRNTLKRKRIVEKIEDTYYKRLKTLDEEIKSKSKD
jgi:hypothetical protein